MGPKEKKRNGHSHEPGKWREPDRPMHGMDMQEAKNLVLGLTNTNIEDEWCGRKRI